MEAGTIAGTNLTGTVTWNPSFRGLASVAVQAVGTCQSAASVEKTVTVTSSVGIGEHNNSNVRIFPNPTTGKFTIEIKGTGTVSVNVFNAIGVSVFSEKDITSTGKISRTIDLSLMPEGVYYLKVEGDAGSTVQKIILQR